MTNDWTQWTPEPGTILGPDDSGQYVTWNGRGVEPARGAIAMQALGRLQRTRDPLSVTEVRLLIGMRVSR